MTGCGVEAPEIRANLARQVSTALHDLAQPMTSLHLVLEAIRCSSLHDDSRDLVELALAEIDRCRGELGYLRELARIHDTGQEPRTAICVLQILEETVESQIDAFLDSGVEVYLDKSVHEFVLHMPESQIRTLFFNMLRLAHTGCQAGSRVDIQASEAHRITISCSSSSSSSLRHDNRESKRAMNLIQAIAGTNGIVTQWNSSPFAISLSF
jgi:signal transduction histidine kinase